MLGMISFGCAIGALALLLDGFDSKRSVTSVSAGTEIGFGFGLIVIAIICAVLSNFMGEDD